jgi:hypothetical protein
MEQTTQFSNATIQPGIIASSKGACLTWLMFLMVSSLCQDFLLDSQ